MPAFDAEAYTAALRGAKELLFQMVDRDNWNPILLRFAWHDAGSFSGANGSIRFDAELKHGGNAGLAKCVKYLQPVKEKFPILSWADIIQMAGAVAVEHAGGPKIAMRYGRVDATEPSKEGALPDALPPFKQGSPAAHLRAVMGRMGFGDREIVALSGAHTIGRAFKDRSGTVDEPAGKGTKYTMPGGICPRFDKKPDSFGMPGGRSWTPNWLTFDNSYFTLKHDVPAGGPGNTKDGLAWFPTDAILATDKGFAPYFNLYARNQDAFFQDYAEAHRRLSEVGSTWVVPGGITFPEFDKSKL